MRAVLALPGVRVLLIGQACSIFGDAALWLAAGIWVKSLTGSNAAAGLTFLFISAPSLLAPLAGLLVDRVRRRPLLIAVNAATGLLVLLLLLVRDAGQVWLIYAVMTCYGLSNSLLGSAQSALLKTVVPDELLGHANGFLQTVREGLRLVVPLAGAGLFALLGGGAVAVLDAATFAVAVLALLVVRIREPRPEPDASPWLAQVAAGFGHIRRTADLRRLTIACAAVLLVVGMLETIGFAVVGQGLHRPPAFLGVVIAVQGVGAVAGGLTAARLMQRIGGVRIAGLGIVALAAGACGWTVPTLPTVFAGSIAFGLGLPWLIVGAFTSVQRLSPDALQGRVFSAFDTAVSVPQTVGIAAGAALVAVVPYPVLLAVVAVVSLLAGLLLVRSSRTAEPAGSQDADAAEVASGRTPG